MNSNSENFSIVYVSIQQLIHVLRANLASLNSQKIKGVAAEYKSLFYSLGKHYSK